jgi:hypothetical protein
MRRHFGARSSPWATAPRARSARSSSRGSSNGHLEPIAYTYEADYHCPGCAVARFGADVNGYAAGDVDRWEGNPVGAVFPWDEWLPCDDAGAQTLACGTCGAVLDEYGPADEPSPDRGG